MKRTLEISLRKFIYGAIACLIAISLILLSHPYAGWSSPTLTSQTFFTIPTFQSHWCPHKASLSTATQQTVNALLQIVGTEDCDRASVLLRQTEELDLSVRSLSDLRPLQEFNQLTSLDLSLNQIQDIALLRPLSKLRRLLIGSNLITDLQPLSHLSNLEVLGLSNNPVTDLRVVTGSIQLAIALSLWQFH
ncbi:leucine-rich repeat domain-containing protein [bacterium]|nr:leucine-rich repeat domain-containing protein [bacterium]